MRSKYWAFGLFLLFANCNRDLSDDPIPIVNFPDEPVTLSAYPTLNIDGGSALINNIGVRGVILYRLNSTTYYAYERNCSYHPNEACATVNVDPTGLYMTDPCCGSSFSFTNGNPTGGIAWRPLRRYRTELQGSTLIISSDIL